MSFGGEVPKSKQLTYDELVKQVWSMTIQDQEELLKLLEKNNNGRRKSERCPGRVPGTGYVEDVVGAPI